MPHHQDDGDPRDERLHERQCRGGTTIESVVLAFAKVDLEYKPQKPDGSLDVGLHFKYDLKAQKEG